MSSGSDRQRLPAALTIAGSDSSGGAGIQADLKTFTALGVYGATVITALTAQNTLGVQAIAAVDPQFVGAQLGSVLGDLDVRAAKTGMLASAPIIEAVAERLAARPDIQVVVDPVMVATSGDPLIDPAAVEVLVRRLLPRAALITPNLPEAARLTGTAIAGDTDEMIAQARRLIALGAGAALVKGGHGDGPEAIDVLVDSGGSRLLRAPRVATQNTHGTGCTLSAAIVARLVAGDGLPQAVAAAKSYLSAALRAGTTMTVGAGHGPVDHLHALRGKPAGVV